MEKVRLKENLRYLFYKNDTYPSEIAKKTGITKQTLSDWQAGVMPRDPIKLKRLANVLGVNIDQLLFGELNERTISIR
jgi:transcriptional regulator with XRE-family HTH domain